MTAKTVMDPHPCILKPTDSIKTACEFIMDNRYRALPVVDDNGRYLGVFGVNCLLRLVLPKAVVIEKGLKNVSFIDEEPLDLLARLKEVEDQPISVCMRTDLATVAPDTPLVETLLLLYKNHHSIPVVDPETDLLEGVISYFNVGEKILSAEEE